VNKKTGVTYVYEATSFWNKEKRQPRNRQILSMAYYIADRGGPLCHLQAWSKSHIHPYGKVLTSQRISETLRSLGEDEQKSFSSYGGRGF